MKAELTESKLQAAMKEYLERTPDAVILGGLIWTSPERVCQFAAGLGMALAEVIFSVIPAPLGNTPGDGSYAGDDKAVETPTPEG